LLHNLCLEVTYHLLLIIVMPQSRWFGDVTATYIRGQKYPYIYTLSISTSKNQSMKVCGTLYILIYEYNYKIITGYDTILQEYYITDRRKYENTKRYTNMNSTKDAHELQKENSRVEQGAWKEMTLDDLSMIYAFAAHL